MDFDETHFKNLSEFKSQIFKKTQTEIWSETNPDQNSEKKLTR